MNFWGDSGIRHPDFLVPTDLGWGMEAKGDSSRKHWGICVPQPCHASGMWKHHHCWNLEYHGETEGLNRWKKKEREHRKWLRIIQFLIVLRLVLMLVGGKKLKREVFTRFSFISASIFPFQNSVGAMQWGDVVIFVDGKWCQMWSAIRPSFHWWYLSSWACSIHLLCWVVSSHLHRWLQDSKKHITACWQMPSFFCSRFHGFLLRFRCCLALWKFQHLTLRNCWKTKKWNSFTGSFSRSTDMSCCLVKGRLQEMLAFPILKKNFANPGSDSLGWKPDVEMCRLCGWVSQVPLNHNSLRCRANSDFETVFTPLCNVPYRL